MKADWHDARTTVASAVSEANQRGLAQELLSTGVADFAGEIRGVHDPANTRAPSGANQRVQPEQQSERARWSGVRYGPVSQENVDKARSFIEAYNARDFDTALKDFDPEIDWVLPERQSSDSGRGTGAVLRFFEDIEETFDDLWLDPQEYVEAGDMVATRLRHHGRSKSGIELDTELYHQIATFRDGKIVRMEYVGSWPEALEALAR